MATVHVLVLRAPGTNCDGETCHALELAGARPTRMHVHALLEAPEALKDYRVLVIPGGFSYGDDVAAGKILANQLRLRLSDALVRFRDSGRLIFGICNGFQVLVKAGLLPGWEDPVRVEQPATLAANGSGRFEDRWVHLVAEPGACVLLRGIGRLELPVAHGEGRFVCRDRSVLERLRAGGQVVLRYAAPGLAPGAPPSEVQPPPAGPDAPVPYPLNPNGSEADIAGISDPTGRVFGLMPHPERHVHFTQHPRWTRRARAGEGDGLRVFRNAVEYFR